MKSKSFIFKILAVVLSFSLKAQYSEVGIFGGGTNFIGDVGDYGFHLPKDFAVGVFYKYNFNDHWALRVQGNYGRIRNADSLSDFPDRINRNLSFESDIWEGFAALEFNFLRFDPGTKFNHTPYVMGGFGMFWFNPKTEYQGQLYELRELGTEGQNTRGSGSGFYSDASSFFMFGMGYKWAIGKFTTIGFEATFRSTNTDYLDDVSGKYADPDAIEAAHGEVAAALSDRSLSQNNTTDNYRGNPATNDWYIFTGITLQFKFGELYEKCASFVGR